MISWANPHLIDLNSRFLPWIIWANVTFISMMAVISTAGDFLAAPTVRGALMLSSDDMRLINISFILMLGIIPPFAIWLARTYGYKIVFFLAVLLFILGSFLNGISVGFLSFLIARVISGAAAGAIFPLSLAMIEQVFPKHLLVIAIALNVGLSFGIGNIYGFWVAGYLSQYVSWNSFYLHCAILSLPVLVLTWFFSRETPPHPEKKQFDVYGYIAFIVLVSSLILILDGGKAEWNTGGWGSSFIITMSILALVSLVVFVLIERIHPHPLIEFSLLKKKTCLLGCLYIAFVGAIFFATQILSVTFLDGDLHYEKNTIGLFLIPRGVIFGITATGAAFLAKIIGIRPLILVGMTLLTLSCWMNTSITIYSSHSQMQWMWIVRMVGFGLTWGTAVAFALLDVPRTHAGAGSVLIILSRQIGGSLGSLAAGNVVIERTVFHAERFGAQASVSTPSLQNALTQLQTHLSQTVGKTHLEAKAQAAALMRDNVMTQAHATAINDAFFLLGVILGLITLALIVESIWSCTKTKILVE